MVERRKSDTDRIEISPEDAAVLRDLADRCGMSFGFAVSAAVSLGCDDLRQDLDAFVAGVRDGARG